MWPEPFQTNELLQQVTTGRAEAVNQLLDRHRAGLRRMIELRMDRRMARRVDASDVVQDVFLEAHARLAQYLSQPDIPFHLWLRQLAQDRIIDLHRRHHAQRRDVDREQSMTAPRFGDQSSLDLAAQIQDDDLTPAAATIRREMEGRFLQALDQLDEDDREIIHLRHTQQLGNQEAADFLGLTPAAAGMRHTRALRKLKEVLRDHSSG
ncbi:MAG: sigma-70 family RNA polymerase sigma factor [Planctomycetota bacterium]|nr:MAG: sigma-70 family RNA polymerase sigma factor [Planctomycetota bacterium]